MLSLQVVELYSIRVAVASVTIVGSQSDWSILNNSQRLWIYLELLRAEGKVFHSIGYNLSGP